MWHSYIHILSVEDNSNWEAEKANEVSATVLKCGCEAISVISRFFTATVP